MENGLNEFTLKIFNSLSSTSHSDCDDTDDSVLFSPITLISTLLLLVYGSRGYSSVQLARVLLLSSNSSSSQHTLDSTTSSILHVSSLIVKLNANKVNDTQRVNTVSTQSPPNLLTVNVTNLLLTSNSLTVCDDFQLLSQELFNFRTEAVQSPSDNDKLLRHIFTCLFNEVSPPLTTVRSTHLNRVNSLLHKIETSSQQMTFFSSMFLGLQFKHKFSEIGKQRFYRTPFNSSDVLFVSSESHFDSGYNEHLQSTVLRLPLNRHNLHMMILLPDHGHCVKSVASKLTQLKDVYSTVAENVTRKLTHVQMPFIDITWSGSLKRTLVNNGIRGIFNTHEANLINISPDVPSATVGDVFQSNRLCMHHTSSDSSYDESQRHSNAIDEITVNRPFIFLISKMRNKRIKDVILMGTYTSSFH